MKYLVVSRFDPAAVERLRSQLPAPAFAYIDAAIHGRRVPGGADFEAQGARLPRAGAGRPLRPPRRAAPRRAAAARGPCEGCTHALNVFESEAGARALRDVDPLARHGHFRAEQVYAWRQVF